MWILIFLFMLLLSAGGIWYSLARFACFFEKFGRRKAFLFGGLLLIAVFAALQLWSGTWNTMIVFIHLMLFLLIADACRAIAGKLRGKKPSGRIFALSAIIVTAVYVCIGVFFCHHVFRTEYNISDTGTEGLRIVGFSDSHLGTVFGADRLADYVEDINRENPDIVVIVGDYVDDDSSYDEMIAGCEALSGIRSRYGVFYVFGNHDSGYYNSHRGYGADELIENLEKNNVVVMKDDVLNITGNIYLCGRLDRQFENRRPISELTEGHSADDYIIVLDHQPNDYAEESAAGSDLVISGHTHGGQFLPINRAGEWIGANDMTYGHSRIDGTDFIVSSGIADWAFQIKTGCISEYFVINLK